MCAQPTPNQPPPTTVGLCWSEIHALSVIAARFLRLSHGILRRIYDTTLGQHELSQSTTTTLAAAATAAAARYCYLPDIVVHGRKFGCIHAGFRQRSPLAHDMDMGTVVLAVCLSHSGRNHGHGSDGRREAHGLVVLPLVSSVRAEFVRLATPDVGGDDVDVDDHEQDDDSDDDDGDDNVDDYGDINAGLLKSEQMFDGSAFAVSDPNFVVNFGPI